jgi:50S ribosomal protein L16 3-hydroxylase
MQLLGGLTPRAFLRGYWQKRPLLVRGALQQLAGARGELRDLRTLAALAARDDVESRMVERRGGQWKTAHGPFPRFHLRKSGATLLVSGINLHLAAADALLRRFAFIPQARLDDVMVSYASPGGGVGPHVDSYDVFLLQGPGRRRWTWWFSGKRQSTVVESGDLLYLPPGVKHDGMALEPCFTYSIGFRAPRGAELGAAFLDWLHRRGLPDARYRDPRLAPARHAGAIPHAMVEFSRRTLGKIRWSAPEIARFLGEYLTEPKPHVVFAPGRSRRGLAGARVRLDPKSLLLHYRGEFFMNGERVGDLRRGRGALRELADRRGIAGEKLAGARLRDLIYRWRRLGYLHLD